MTVLAEKKNCPYAFLSDMHSQCDRWTDGLYAIPKFPTCFFKSKFDNIVPHCVNPTGTTQVLHVKTSYKVAQAQQCMTSQCRQPEITKQSIMTKHT